MHNIFRWVKLSTSVVIAILIIIISIKAQDEVVDATYLYYYETVDIPLETDAVHHFEFTAFRGEKVTIVAYGLDDRVRPELTLRESGGNEVAASSSDEQPYVQYIQYTTRENQNYIFSVTSKESAEGESLARIMLIEGDPIREDLTYLDTVNPLLPGRVFMVAGSNEVDTNVPENSGSDVLDSIPGLRVGAEVLPVDRFRYKPDIFVSRGSTDFYPTKEERLHPATSHVWFNDDGEKIYFFTIHATPEDLTPATQSVAFKEQALNLLTFFYYDYLFVVGIGSEPISFATQVQECSETLLENREDCDREPVAPIERESIVAEDEITEEEEIIGLFGGFYCSYIIVTEPGYVFGDECNDFIDIYAYGSVYAYGQGGDDFIWGGFYDDYLFGGYGDDYLDGWYGNDYLDGGSGYDYIYGGPGNDTIVASSGFDYISGGSGRDTFRAYWSWYPYYDIYSCGNYCWDGSYGLAQGYYSDYYGSAFFSSIEVLSGSNYDYGYYYISGYFGYTVNGYYLYLSGGEGYDFYWFTWGTTGYIYMDYSSYFEDVFYYGGSSATLNYVGSNIYQVFSSSCGCYTGLNIIFTESGGLSLSTGTEVSGLLASVGADLSEAILADNVNTIASALETSTADDAGSSGGSSLVNAYPLYETVADEIAVNESAIDTVAQEIVFPTPTPDETTVVAEETPATTTNTNTPEVTEEAPKTDTSGD